MIDFFRVQKALDDLVVFCNLIIFIMSTAPKLTYAKIGNKSKNKVEPSSTELIRHQQQKSEDLFSQMNQENLNYIKKQLKLKKNRSQHDRTRVNKDEQKEQLQDQITQREKIYHKYKGEEQVSERQPYLQETERKSSEQKPLQIQLSEEAQEQDAEFKENQHFKMFQKQQLSTSQKEQQKTFTKIPDTSKMYQSLPYEQPKKRVVSIQGYFRESVSTNLQKFRESGANFMQFLEDYISDLNQSKHLKSKPQDQSSAEKLPVERQRGNKYTKESVKSVKNSTHRKETSEQEDERMKEELKKMERLKRNSDTFGEPNSKYTVHSSLSYDSMDLQMKLKKEQLHCLMLAKQVQSLRQSLGDKDKIIKKLRLSNELLEQEITHLKAQQDIIMKNKGDFPYERPNKSQKHTKRVNDENLLNDYDNGYNHFILSHQRHGSVNPSINNRTGYSYRGNSHHNLREQELAEFNQPLFQQFATSTNKHRQRQSTPRKDNRSIQKLQREFQEFLQQSSLNTKKGGYKYK